MDGIETRATEAEGRASFIFAIATWRRWVGAAPLLVLAACEFTTPQRPTADKRAAALARAETARMQRACGSQAGYDRLKSMTFVEAARIRRADSPALKRLASLSVVRMDKPVPRARDAALGVTVCSGRFVLELPPGAERLFAGDRRLEADVEYAAQEAADGSGPVYQMRGAEPIVYRLAAVGLRVREPVLLGTPAFAAAVVPAVPAPLPSPSASRAPAALASAPAPASVAATPDPSPSPALKRVASAPRPVPSISKPARPDAPQRLARSGKREAVRTAARDTVRTKPVKLALRAAAPRQSKALAAARPVPVRAATRPARVVAERAKPRAGTVGLARAKAQSTAKTLAAPVRLAGKTKAPKLPVRLAQAKAARAVPVKLVARTGVRAARPTVATRPVLKALPVRLAARPGSPTVRVAATRVAVQPSFGCDAADSRVERLICEDPWLARADRAMSVAFYRALDDADPYARRQLLRTRAAFLAYRDRCGGARCVAEAYADRIAEIRDIAADRY